MPEVHTFELLGDLLPEPMVLVSHTGTILSVNRAFAALSGRARADLVSRSIDDIATFGESDARDYLRRCSGARHLVFGGAALIGGDGRRLPVRCEGALYTPRGEHGPARILLRLTPKNTSSSRFVALSQQIGELSAEISRRQRVERELREQRELLDVTLRSIGDAVIVSDGGGHVTFMNEGAARLTGWDCESARGQLARNVFRLIDEDTRQTVERPAGQVILVARDGTERPVSQSAAPIVDSSGQAHGTVFVFRDATAERAAERHHAAARRAAEDANRAKDEFLATLSHELRTPLNAILGWARILRDDTRSAAAASRGLRVIERNAQVQARLIEDLLDVSRITAGQLRLDREVVDLGGVIDAALDAVRPSAQNKELQLSAPPSVDAAVRGDSRRLQQVLWNLLANAVKFTPPGGSVSVAVECEPSLVRISVRDSGEGFPASFKPYMFDAFSQANASLARPHGGLGLGLTIVRRLVEAHGGTIDANSDGPNQGAVFTVTLPSADAAAPPSAASSPPTVADLEGCVALVTDDDADSSELMKIVLEAKGASVIVANTARQALAVLDTERVDILFADLAMPEEDGLWLIRQVRAHSRHDRRTMPAVAVTAFASIRDRQAALFAGFDDHLAKPVTPEAITQSVADARKRAAARPV